MIKLFRFVLSLLVFASIAKSPQAADRPNVVWLISEDNSHHYLKMFDPHGAETPRIAELAAHGLIYDHAFSNAPVCSVARTTLITGCYAPRIGTQFHRKHVTVPMPSGLKMFPEYMRKVGYYTANNAKKDYNAIEGEGVWNASSRKATWRNRKPGQPFFYVQSFTATHESSLHFPKKVMENQKTTTDPATVFVAPYHPDTKTFRYTNARYRDNIQRVDQQIGAVVDKLEEDGLLEETFVFYFGDHGGVLPRGKGYAYESGLHVPLVVRVPEKWKHLVDAELGSRQTGFVSFIDFGPTTLHLAGIDVPEQVDGKPFLGKGVTASEVNKRNTAFGYADRFDEKYDLVRTWRKGRFEYIRNYQPFNFDGLQNNYRYRMLAYQEWRELYEAGKLNAAQSHFFETRPVEELYDIEADPHEVKNLAGDPAYAATLKELRGELSAFISQLPDLSFIPESVLAEKVFDAPAEFGQRHQQSIANLVATADLSLLPFDEAKPKIEEALNSKNPGQRYWGLIVCSCFEDEAKDLATQAATLAENDPQRLVRIRAAEFLGLIGAADPQPVFIKALKETNSGIEAGLILNSLTLLQDGKPGYKFEITKDLFQNEVLKNDTVKRRLEYLKQ